MGKFSFSYCLTNIFGNLDFFKISGLRVLLWMSIFTGFDVFKISGPRVLSRMLIFPDFDVVWFFGVRR